MRRQAGFSLAEVLVATALLAVALISLAQILAIAVMNNAVALNSTYTSVLAAQKIEQLRALTWTFDDFGSPIGDAGLVRSPATTLETNTAGYVDYLDVDGALLGAGADIPSGTVYIRRWSIALLAASPDNTLVIQVLVARARTGRGPATRAPGDARLLTLKTRKRS